MSKKQLNLSFCDFWPNFDPRSNFFVWALEPHYDIKIVHPYCGAADLLVFSVFGSGHVHARSRKRICFIGENVRPNLEAADLTMSFDFLDDPRHVRFPLWIFYTDVFGKDPDPEHVPLSVLTSESRKFSDGQSDAVMMLASNPCGFRLSLWPKLRESLGDRAVSLGRVCHTPGAPEVPVGDKFAYVNRYKLNLAIENSRHPGYTTEKILQAYAGNAIPVYHGDPRVEVDFNPRSFLNINDMTEEQAAAAISELLNDPEAMEAMLSERPLAREFDIEPYLRPILAVAEDAVSRR